MSLSQVCSRIQNGCEPSIFVSSCNEALRLMQRSTFEPIYEDTIECMLSSILEVVEPLCDESVDVEVLCSNVTLLSELYRICLLIVRLLVSHKKSVVSLSYIVTSTLFRIIERTCVLYKHCCLLSDQIIESIEPILALFKLTRKIHFEFTQWLCLVKRMYMDRKQKLFKVLDALSHLSDVLCDLNVKMFIDNWQAFIQLINFDEPMDYNIRIIAPMQHLTNQIEKQLRKLLQGNCQENGTEVETHLDLAVFLIKIVLRIIQVWQRANNEAYYKVMWNFFMTTYNYPCAKFKAHGYSDTLIDSLRTKIFDLIRPVFAYMGKFDWMSEALNAMDYDVQYKESYILVLSELLQTAPGIPNETAIYAVVCAVLDAVEDGMFTVCYIDEEVYQQLVVNMTVAIMRNTNNFENVGVKLIRNMLCGKFWPSILAVDIWCSLMRRMDAKLLEDIFSAMIVLYNKLRFGLIVSWPQSIFLHVCIEKMWCILPKNTSIRIQPSSGIDTNFLTKNEQNLKIICEDLERISNTVIDNSMPAAQFRMMLGYLNQLTRWKQQFNLETVKTLVVLGNSVIIAKDLNVSPLAKIFTLKVLHLLLLCSSLLGGQEISQIFLLLRRLLTESGCDALIQFYACSIVGACNWAKTHANSECKQYAMELLELCKKTMENSVLENKLVIAKHRLMTNMQDLKQSNITWTELEQIFKELIQCESVVAHKCLLWTEVCLPEVRERPSKHVGVPSSKRPRLDVLPTAQNKPTCEADNGDGAISEVLDELKSVAKRLKKIVGLKKLSKKQINALRATGRILEELFY